MVVAGSGGGGGGGGGGNDQGSYSFIKSKFKDFSRTSFNFSSTENY